MALAIYTARPAAPRRRHRCGRSCCGERCRRAGERTWRALAALATSRSGSALRRQSRPAPPTEAVGEVAAARSSRLCNACEREGRNAQEAAHDDRIGAGGPLPDSVAGAAVGFDPRHHGGVRADHGARARCGWRRGARLHLHGGRGRRRHPRSDRARPRAAACGRGRDADRGALAAAVVAGALRRPRRPGGPCHLGDRHRALGPHGETPRAAALAPARRPRPARAGLCRRHRSAVPARAAAAPDRGQPGEGLSRDQDEGRPRAARRGRRARGRHARAARAGCPADGRRQHALERRSGDPGGAGLGRARRVLARGADHPGRRRQAMPAS